MFRIVSDPIEEHLKDADLREESRGAIISFEGRVRNHNNNKEVTQLDYEAYEELAVTEAKTIFDEAMVRFDIESIAGFHRVGELNPGQLAFWIGVGASHRDPAFKACRYAVDEIKQRITVWKKEYYADGSSDRINHP